MLSLLCSNGTVVVVSYCENCMLVSRIGRPECTILLGFGESGALRALRIPPLNLSYFHLAISHMDQGTAAVAVLEYIWAGSKRDSASILTNKGPREHSRVKANL